MSESSDTVSEELLKSYRPWLRKVASGMVTGPAVEDLAQEGWIALWRAWLVWRKEGEGGAPLDWWLKKKAHGRMLTLVTRDWQTQKAQAWGIPAGAATVTDEPSVWDELLVDLPEVELAYHHGEIAEALDELTARQREYVVLRFWHGYRGAEMKQHFGYEPSALWRDAKKALISSLRHLKGEGVEHTPEAGIGRVSVETGQGYGVKKNGVCER